MRSRGESSRMAAGAMVALGTSSANSRARFLEVENNHTAAAVGTEVDMAVVILSAS
jgi:hypothetical protein